MGPTYKACFEHCQTFWMWFVEWNRGKEITTLVFCKSIHRVLNIATLFGTMTDKLTACTVDACTWNDVSRAATIVFVQMRACVCVRSIMEVRSKKAAKRHVDYVCRRRVFISSRFPKESSLSSFLKILFKKEIYKSLYNMVETIVWAVRVSVCIHCVKKPSTDKRMDEYRRMVKHGRSLAEIQQFSRGSTRSGRSLF